MIKFRIFFEDGDYKSMVYDSDRYMLGQNGILYENYGESWQKPVWENVFDTEYKILLFTGVLDKNGKEIYDGDILLINRLLTDSPKLGGENGGFNWYDLIEKGEIHKSMVRTGYCIFYKSYDDIEDILFGCEHRYEVIGNRYENPELISKE